MGNYQDRKDIDRLYDELYSRDDGSLNVLKFKDESPYKNISYDMDGNDRGTIDAILNYYGLTEGGGGGGDLSDYFTKEEINTILSSYVTTETIEDYQPLLESGVNIKTINNQSILGEGNIHISGGSTDIVTSWGNPTSDEKVPSEKLAKTTLDEKVNRSELHNLDINLTTLELVPKSTNPNGVICFEDKGSKYIEKSNTSGLVKNDGTIDTTQYLSSLPSHNHDDRYYTESEVDSALNGKQATLVSGTNIKTVNNESLLGSGNITIQGGGGSVIGTGSFSINNQGHLIVELPNAVDNPYFINNQGHLIYDTSNTHNGS